MTVRVELFGLIEIVVAISLTGIAGKEAMPSRSASVEQGELPEDSSDRYRHGHSTRGRHHDEKSRNERRKRSSSPEHKRRRRMASIERRGDAPVDESMEETLKKSHYSSLDNPFNDAGLDHKFTWHKKRDKEKMAGLSSTEAEQRDRERRIEAQSELEKLIQRRAEREARMEARQAEMEQAQRDAETAQMAEWIAKEDEFYLEQAKRRAEIRVKNGRAKPIDLLAINLRLADNADEIDDTGIEIELEEPYRIFENLTLEEIKELHKDIQMYLSLERKEVNLDFWRAMIVVCEDKLNQAQNERQKGTGIDPVQADINELLSSKTYDQLNILQGQIQHKLGSNEPVDVDYWEQLLKSLIVWKAKIKLRKMHEVVLRNRLEQLRRLQRDEANKAQLELQNAVAKQQLAAEEQQAEIAEASTESVQYTREMSPEKAFKIGWDDESLEVMDQAKFTQRLMAKRREVVGDKFIVRRKTKTAVAELTLPVEDAALDPTPEATQSQFLEKQIELFEEEAAHDDSSDDEEISNIDAELRRQSYLYDDKYRPRKPRYFNRVLTGFEWNTYNKTHYDVDNPPPKSVQGYKFNIFYPDLIDKSKAPTYELIKIPDDEDTVMIKFVAGPPYEDIAFRIVQHDWEFSHKKGFRSRFDRGVLQLHVFFKRGYYRK